MFLTPLSKARQLRLEAFKKKKELVEGWGQIKWGQSKAAQHKKGKEHGKGDLCKGVHFSTYWGLQFERDDKEKKG